MRVFPETHAVAYVPKLERVRAAHRQRLAEAPLIAVLSDRLFRHDGQCPKRAQLEKKRSGGGQLDAHGFVVDRPYAKPAEVGEFAAVDGLGILHVKEHPGVVAGGVGIDGAAPRVNHVVRGDPPAGGPLEAITQVEGVYGAVAGNFPALGQGRLGVGGDGVEAGEPIEQCRDDAAVGLAGDDRRVERLGVGAVDDDEVRRFVPLKTARLAKQAQAQKKAFPADAQERR